MIISAPNKEQFAKALCLFLAEELRTHQISLKRSAGIAQKMLDHINLIDTEEDFLKLIKELQMDFEELFDLRKTVQLNVQVNARDRMQQLVREFVINSLALDPKMALAVLLEATKDQVQLPELENEFPAFKQFTQGQL